MLYIFTLKNRGGWGKLSQSNE